jgi:tetratricopeptide (TPR) repeat protein
MTAALGASASARAQDAGAAVSPPVVQADATGRWIRGESEHFIVYSDRNEALIRRYVTMLEDFDGVLRLLHNKTDAETPRKLPLYLLSSSRQLRRTLPNADDRLQGVYLTGVEDIFVLAIRDDSNAYDPNNGDDTVLHEYTHHFMMQYFPDAYPGWLVEGLAEYYKTIDLRMKTVQIGDFSRGRAVSLLNDKWLPMSDILSKRPSQFERDQILTFYAQSWLLTHYIWSDKTRRAKLQDYLELVRAHGDPMASWTKIYGQDSAALEKALRGYMGVLPALTIGREPPKPQIAFSRLPAGADDLILEVQRLKTGVARAEAPALLARFQETAAKRPTEYYSRLALARAEIDLGDRSKGEAILAALLEERPADLETLQVMAYSRLETARRLARTPADREKAKAIYAEAATYLGRAHKIDDDNYLTLYGYAEAKSLDREPSENTLNVVLRAASIAPQNPAIRMNAARLFIRARKYEIARELMEPVAGNPHGGPQARRASHLLASLEGKADGEALTPAKAAAASGEGDKDAPGG